MKKRKNLYDVKQAIRTIICQAEDDANSDIQYVKLTGRGRLLAMEILCMLMEFTELENVIRATLKQIYENEQQILKEKIGDGT